MTFADPTTPASTPTCEDCGEDCGLAAQDNGTNVYTACACPPHVAVAAPEPRVFEVLLGRHESVETSLVKLAKRAARKGLDGAFSWSWGGAYVETRVERAEEYGRAFDRTVKIDRITLTIHGETPKFEGWTFLAALDHMQGDDGKTVNVVRALPGMSCPAQYRNRGPICDHCKANRRRGATYVVRHDDGRTTQVGSTCMVDFLGHDGFRVAALATFLAEIAAIAEDDDDRLGGGSASRGDGSMRLDDYLPFVAAIIRVEGWISRTAARQAEGEVMATADLASMLKTYKQTGHSPSPSFAAAFGKIDITPEDIARATRSIEWAQAIAEDTDQDYLHNCRAIAACNLVTRKSTGIAASIISACEREDAKKVVQAQRASAPAYFGTVGQRETFTLTLVGESTWETAYGTTFLYRFVNQNGSTATWKASSNQDLRKGQTYQVKATVKEHGTFKDMPQTVLTRCKVEAPKDEVVS